MLHRKEPGALGNAKWAVAEPNRPPPMSRGRCPFDARQRRDDSWLML